MDTGGAGPGCSALHILAGKNWNEGEYIVSKWMHHLLTFICKRCGEDARSFNSESITLPQSYEDGAQSPLDNEPFTAEDEEGRGGVRAVKVGILVW